MTRILCASVAWLGILVGGVSAQATIAGNWQGTVTFGPQTLRVGLIVEPGSAGPRFVIIDQDNATAPVQQMTRTGNTVHFEMPSLRASFEGTINDRGDAIAGALNVGGPVPLTLRRVAALDQPPVFGEQEKADVGTAINSYFAAFTRKDFEAFQATLLAPFVRW